MKKSFIFVFMLQFFVVALLAQEPVKNEPDTSAAKELENVPTASMTEADLENNTEGQDVSGLLQSARDAYTSLAGYNFGQARFRIRGYGAENTAVMINGVESNDMETGRPSFYTWGGLNDVTRYPEIRTGIAPSPFSFSGIGGYSNINARASNFRKGSRFSYAISNRSYDNRVMLTHSTGMMPNNWAITASGSRRWAQEGYVDGTFYDGWSYFLSAEKKVNNQHSLGFIAYGAPTKSGAAGIATQETYDLVGSNYYNPYWGFQNGEKRNSRVRSNHLPMLMLNHYWTIDEKSKLQSSLYYSFGKNGYTMLNWYDANDPNPNYYRYLPSYWLNENDVLFDYYTNLWQNDEAGRQIQWDNFYFANSKNLYTVHDVDGVAGNNVTGNRSKYIVEEARNFHNHWGLTSAYSNVLTDKLTINGGLNASIYKNNYFKVMSDLLGGDFWVDVDQFAERDFNDPDIAQNDLNTPNRVIKKGDKFGYDYDANINKADVFGQGTYTLDKFDFFGALSLSTTSFWRTGYMKNGKFPDNSYGDSEKQNFFNYGVKGGVTYKLTGRHIFTANGAYITRAPEFRNAYISPRTRDFIPTALTNEKILSGDLNYIVRYPNLKTRLTWYYTQINDQIWLRSFYHDEYRTFVNFQMSDVDNLHTGVELGVDWNINSSLQFTGAFTKSENIWNSRPNIVIARDNDASILAENKVAYLQNYKIGGMPQTAASGALRYNGKQFWFVGVNFNYFADMYLDVNPDRRTAEALDGYVVSDPQWGEILGQTKLDNAYTLDMFCGKSFKIKNYFININLNVNNLLNNTDFITGGFEQLRYDTQNIGKFPPKFSYMYGRTYFAMVSFRF